MQVITPPSGEGIIESGYLNRKDRREFERGNLRHFKNQCVRDDLETSQKMDISFRFPHGHTWAYAGREQVWMRSSHWGRMGRLSRVR